MSSNALCAILQKSVNVCVDFFFTVYGVDSSPLFAVSLSWPADVLRVRSCDLYATI